MGLKEKLFVDHEGITFESWWISHILGKCMKCGKKTKEFYYFGHGFSICESCCVMAEYDGCSLPIEPGEPDYVRGGKK